MPQVRSRQEKFRILLQSCPTHEAISKWNFGVSYNFLGEEVSLEGIGTGDDGNQLQSDWVHTSVGNTSLFEMDREHTIQFSEEWLQEFNRQPFVSVLLWRTKKIQEGEDGCPKEAIHHLVLDLSSLLVGDSIVRHVSGHVPKVVMPEPPSPTDGDDEDEMTEVDALVMESKQKFDSLVEQFSSVLSFPQVEDLSFFSMSVSTSSQDGLLSDEEKYDWNPLSILIEEVKRLPGVGADDTQFSLQKEFCVNPYAVIRPIPGLSVGRVVGTPGQQFGRKCKWNTKTVFLTGNLSQCEIEQIFDNEKLVVEVHDRDPKSAIQARWEKVQDAFSTEKANISPETQVTASVKGVLEGMLDQWQNMGDDCTHGVAALELQCLFDQSKHLSMAFAKTGQIETTDASHANWHKLSSIVTPSKKRKVPKGGDDEWALSQGERLVRKPACFIAEDTSVVVSLQLFRPHRAVNTIALDRCFSRAFYAFEYKNAGLLQAMNKIMEEINSTSLGSIQGSLRSHKLSESEVKAAESGNLDIIGGFQVIDDKYRIIVVEGLAHTIQTLNERIPRQHANDQSCRILWDPLVTFNNRIYTPFNVDLKKLKLRDPLPTLCMSPEIYNRSKVSEGCFEALQRLYAMRKATCMREVAAEGLFPTCSQLLEIESKYGEAISLEDIEGVKRPPKKPDSRCATTYHALLEQRNNSLGEIEAVDALVTQVVGEQSKERERRKAATDAQNPAFELAIKSRPEKDFIQQQKDLLARSTVLYESMKSERLREIEEDEIECRHVYSGQALQYTELKKAQLRSQLAKEKNTHFTYSKDFLSAAVPLVDTSIKVDERAKWKTKRGFVYPAPKKPEDFKAHPQKPSQSRIEALSEPWVENELHPQPVSRNAMLDPDQRDFDAIPAQGNNLFGGFHPPSFERQYDNNNLGNESRLPRGRMHLKKNPEYFKSVHLTGEGLAIEREETKRKEYEAWRSKVVVDELSIRPACGFAVRDRPIQMDKTQDILRGSPRSKALRAARQSRLPNGKIVPMEVPPVSVFSQLPFEESLDFTTLLRQDDPQQFIGRTMTGEPLTFQSTINRHAGHPRSQTFVSSRHIPPLNEAERTGPRWE